MTGRKPVSPDKNLTRHHRPSEHDIDNIVLLLFFKICTELLRCETANNSKNVSVQQTAAALIKCQIRCRREQVNTAQGRQVSTSKKKAVLHSSSDAFFCIGALMYLLQCNWLLKQACRNFSANLQKQ